VWSRGASMAPPGGRAATREGVRRGMKGRTLSGAALARWGTRDKRLAKGTLAGAQCIHCD